MHYHVMDFPGRALIALQMEKIVFLQFCRDVSIRKVNEEKVIPPRSTSSVGGKAQAVG